MPGVQENVQRLWMENGIIVCRIHLLHGGPYTFTKGTVISVVTRKKSGSLIAVRGIVHDKVSRIGEPTDLICDVCDQVFDVVFVQNDPNIRHTRISHASNVGG